MPSLVDLLRTSSQRAPAHEAIVDGMRRISYGALWRQVGAVAGYLRCQGLQPGNRVALLLENSAEYVAAYYGVLAAGGVVVALNSAARARDLCNWLRHCDAAWLFASARHPELHQLLADMEQPPRLVLIGDETQRPDVAAVEWSRLVVGEPAAPVELEPHTPAAIIYTSGTTGEPKGVTLSHANLVSNALAIIAYLALTAADKVLHLLPFYYSYGNSVLHTHLAVGGCVVIEHGLMYPHKVLQRMVEERVTGFSGVPATYGLLLSRTCLSDYDLSSLRYLTQAGGSMASSHIDQVRALLPAARFFVMYGQTEATARLSYLPPDRLDDKPGSVGIPIPEAEICVMGPNDREALPGQLGEICARGPHVMLGYWCDPEATAAVVRDGWLHTGDLGCRDEDGFLYIHGRASEMIKTGAHRISPSEIEEVIAECDGVAEVAAVGEPDALLGQVIKAVVVARPDALLDARKILAHCRTRLPLYKLPKHVTFVDALPKTASGKIRRHTLQTIKTDQLAGSESC